MQVTFVLHHEASLGALSNLDPDRDWREFVTGERAWILQTYLRLKREGDDVHLAATLPQSGIAIFSSKQRRALQKTPPGSTSAILVGVRQDVGEALIADFEVVQNPSQSDMRRCFLLPHWPQPGLIQRDPRRGATVDSVCFKGFSANLTPEYAAPEWFEFLSDHGLRWRMDSVPHREGGVESDALNWNDFSAVDVVLAIRPLDRKLHPRKPATKLYNAWLAGVPAILGPEIAYRELRRSPLDYIEVNNLRETQKAILKLKNDPTLYQAMIENGRRRATEFTPDRIIEQWRALLRETLPALATAPHVRRWRGRSLRLKEYSRRVARLVGAWP